MNFTIRRNALILICLSALLLGAPVFAQDEALPSIDTIVAANLESLGGTEAWDAVQTIQMKGSLGLPGGMEASLVMTLKRPDKMRMEFTLQGMTGIQAFDGTKGWQIMPFMGKPDAEEMSPSETDDVRDQAEFDPIFHKWEERGFQLEVLGRDEVEGAAVIKVKVTKDDGKEEIYFLDDEYFLPIKQTGEAEQMGNKVAYEVTISDYKEVEGLMIPHTMMQGAIGQPAMNTIRFETIVINTEVSDDIFEMPEPAPAADNDKEEAGGGK